MKKLSMLMIFLLASFKGISQNDTIAVKLNDPVAREVIKDLIRGDACVQELKQTQFTLQLTEKKVDKLSAVVANLEKDKSKSDDIIVLKDQQLESKDIIIKDTEKMLKKQNTVSWIYKVGTIIGVVTSGYLLLK